MVGLGVGAFAGVCRLFEGKPGLALLEITSGAASCIPGFGTALSLGWFIYDQNLLFLMVNLIIVRH